MTHLSLSDWIHHLEIPKVVQIKLIPVPLVDLSLVLFLLLNQLFLSLHSLVEVFLCLLLEFLFPSH